MGTPLSPKVIDKTSKTHLCILFGSSVKVRSCASMCRIDLMYERAFESFAKGDVSCRLTPVAPQGEASALFSFCVTLRGVGFSSLVIPRNPLRLRALVFL